MPKHAGKAKRIGWRARSWDMASAHGTWLLSEKIEQDHGDYSLGTKTKHRGICEHYHEDTCDIVKGFIDPSYCANMCRRM